MDTDEGLRDDRAKCI